MHKAAPICRFYHNIGGRRGCTRPSCRFVHSIEEHVNVLLERSCGDADAEKIMSLLAFADSVPTTVQGVVAKKPEDTALLFCESVAPEVGRELVHACALELGSDAVVTAYLQLAAQAVVVEAIAATEDRIDPCLRGTLLDELERSFLVPGCAEVLDTWATLPESKSVFYQHRALEAFEKRRVLEEAQSDAVSRSNAAGGAA